METEHTGSWGSSMLARRVGDTLLQPMATAVLPLQASLLSEGVVDTAC